VSWNQERKSTVDPMPPRGWWCAGLLSMADCRALLTSNATAQQAWPTDLKCVRWTHIDRDVRRARACT
jgi:hypothetical protein